MEALLAQAVTLRTFLQSASEQRIDDALDQNLSKETGEDVTFALDYTFLILSGTEPFPRPLWSCETCISHTELVHHVIEVLLARKRTINWEDADILTLGYREVAPEAAGHRVTQSNAVICYYPNTLVATLKNPCWGSLHELMGDDLMTHLLLNYTVVVQLKGDPGSYMQLTGKSLRLQKRQGARCYSYTDKSEVSINQAMFARSFQKDRVFANSHVLVKASKTGDPISRSEAARVLRSIFPEDAGKKRLPKRLINLIPTIQSMTSRFKACQVEELAKKLTPINADFRKFMADNPSIKHKLAQRVDDVKASSQPLILPIVRRALDDGYLSQDEGVAPSSSRKRKRREEAIETLSNVSGGPLKTTPEESSQTQKKLKTPGSKAEVSDLTKLQQHKGDIQKLLVFSTPKKKIYRLVRKFVARVVPKELWGNTDTKNWKHVKEMLRKLIFSRKFDVLSLKKRAQEFQVTNVKWMNIGSNDKFCPPNERVKRQKLFETLLWWLVSSLVFPLLRNLFYITETEGMANEIAYYQRPVWNVISTLALDDLEGGILQPSSDQSNDRQLATSLLRLLPKSSGVRPLMNLSRAVDQTKVSVNRSMEAVHRVLAFEIERQPKRLLGASVRNIDDIYKRLKPLFREITSCSRCGERQRASNAPMAYCVTVDVERCFDTIRPRKLYQILKRALQEEEYLIRKHWVGRQVAPISSGKNGEPLSSSSFFFKLERPAYPSGQLVGFDELATQSKKKNSLFVDGVVYDYLTKARALELLKEHLSMNVVQVEGREYTQQCGIPQGSVLSTTLCNLYYAHFERRVLRKSLPEVCDPSTVPTCCCQHEELFRYTDDFMYVTTDLKRAQRFFKVMHEGNEDYGCFVNVAKSQANFEPEGELAALQVSEGYISWCGMLIDPTKLQVYVNYEKLSTPLLQHSIPFNETKTAQDFFVNKVISPVRQRWHALYFDPELLSLDSIHVNLFQTLLVAAHRFTILVEMLPFVNRDMTFFRECIHWILKKMTKSIHRSLEVGMGSTNHSFQAQKYQVWTIGFYAFQLVIQTKLDQIAGTKSQGAEWQQLLNAVHADQEGFTLRAKTQSTALDLGWLLKDQRNANVLKQFLHR